MEKNVIKKVDLLLPPESQYGVLQSFTQSVYQALQRTNVECEIHAPEKKNPRPFLEKVFSNPPDFTLSFHGVLPDSEGRFLCDLINTPHLCLLVDHPFLFSPLTQSKKNIITCPDHIGCQYLLDIGFKNTFFLPHGVDQQIEGKFDNERPIELLFLGSHFDLQGIENHWNNTYPKELVDLLRKTARISIDCPNISFQEILANHLGQWGGFNPKQINVLILLIELEKYIRGLDRKEMLASLSNLTLHTYGSVYESQTEDKEIIHHPNVYFHAPITFKEAIEKMQQSRFVFNSSPSFRYGAHERIFTALAAGASVITQETPSLRLLFDDNEGVIFYQRDKLDALQNTLNHLKNHEEKRIEMVKIGRKKVMQKHTWDTRVARILDLMPPILDRIRSSK